MDRDPVLNVDWTFGHRVLGGDNLREVTRRGERTHLKLIGKLTMTPDTTVADIEGAVEAVWVLGSIEASPEVRDALLARRRWKRSGKGRRNPTTRFLHGEVTTDGLTTDQTVGLVWFDRYELQKLAESGLRVDITVQGILVFAPDATVDLVTTVFKRVKVRGLLFGPPAVRAAIRQLG